MSTRVLAAGLLAALLAVAGCSAAGPGTSPSAPTASGTTSAPPAPPGTPRQSVVPPSASPSASESDSVTAPARSDGSRPAALPALTAAPPGPATERAVPDVAAALRAGAPFTATGTLVDATLGRYGVAVRADGRGSGALTMTLGGGSGELRVVGGQAYVSGDDAFYAAVVGDVDVVAGTWLRLPAGQAAGLAASFRSDALLPDALAVVGAADDGTGATVLRGDGPTGAAVWLVVPPGTALPARVLDVAGTDLTLRWGTPVDVVAPPDAVDL